MFLISVISAACEFVSFQISTPPGEIVRLWLTGGVLLTCACDAVRTAGTTLTDTRRVTTARLEVCPPRETGGNSISSNSSPSHTAGEPLLRGFRSLASVLMPDPVERRYCNQRRIWIIQDIGSGRKNMRG